MIAVLGVVMMVVFGSIENCNLVEWTQERATRNCKAKFANKAFGVKACRRRYLNRLEKALANTFYSGCRSRCVYDIKSMITDARGAFVYKTKKKCWQFVKKGKCFKLKSYEKAIQRAKKMCPAKVAPTYYPTLHPTGNPTLPPTENPTEVPTNFPTAYPTSLPTGNPTVPPTGNPTVPPTRNPSVPPTGYPTLLPTGNPTVPPTGNPTNIPTRNPTYPPIGLVNQTEHPYANGFGRTLNFTAGDNKLIAGMHAKHQSSYSDMLFGFYTREAKGFSCIPEEWSSYVNAHHKEFTFVCGGDDKLIYGVYSEYKSKDRIFRFQCCRLSKEFATGSYKWSRVYTRFFSYKCGENRAYTGVSSVHRNQFNDRTFKLQCSSILRR